MANEANLSVSKTASPTTVTVGDQIVYTITVKNNGPNAATGVKLTDNIPPKACLNSITPPLIGSYTYIDNTITWQIGNLTVGQTVTLTLTVTAIASGGLENTAIVSGNEDPNNSNNRATVLVTVTGPSVPPSADLAVVKVSCPTDVLAGTQFTYFITAINNGPSPVTSALVTDTLPPGISYVSASSSQGSCTYDSGTVTCDTGPIAANKKVEIAITVSAEDTGTFYNTAHITTLDILGDPISGNNSDTTSTIVTGAADLEITKAGSPDTVIIGEQLTYSITVTNKGPSDAPVVTVTEILPPATDIEITSSQGTGCAPIPNEENKYLCSLGKIESGHTATIIVKLNPTTAGCICNTATVNACENVPDPDLTNNTASLCTLVKRVSGADLTVTKTHVPELVSICNHITYTITVTNKGPSPATGVILSDKIPESFKIISTCSSQGHCTSHCDNEVICQLGTIAKDDTSVIKITVKPCHTGTFTNTAIVTGNQEDLYLDNNVATDTITVVTIAEQFEYIASTLAALAAGGIISEENAKPLLAYLESIKHALARAYISRVLYLLGCFIELISQYISENIIPSSDGSPLINIAECIRECLSCDQQRDGEGDE
jgi:uncharacterized repeat protein (TIGR01451 family)